MKSWSAAFFSRFRRKLAAESAEDPEPLERFTASWSAWLFRDLDRRRRHADLNEAEALTTNPADPAPVASLGLPVFLEWASRQERRRRARKVA